MLIDPRVLHSTLPLIREPTAVRARLELNDPNRFNRTCQQTLLVSAVGSTRGPFINDCIGRRANGATRKYPATFSGGFSLHHGSPGTDIKSERTLVCFAMQVYIWESAGSNQLPRGKFKVPLFDLLFFPMSSYRWRFKAFVVPNELYVYSIYVYCSVVYIL